MEINNLDWNFFVVPIAIKDNENNIDYLERVQRCLDKFYETYTKFKEPVRSQYKKHFGGSESLTMEHNFCDMNLEGIVFCDVKYFVFPRNSKLKCNGIDILSHKDKREWREPMVDFLREIWKKFQYEF